MINFKSITENITIHLFILIGLSILTIILFFQFSTEDSYITYRYSQNLVDGKGYVYNPGDARLGTTAPFYGLILAFFGIFGFSIPSVGGVLSAFSLGMSLIFLYLLTLRRGYPLIGLFCGLFILHNPWFLQTFGSETYFQLLMIILAFYFYDRNRYNLTTLFCALAFLVRADGIIPAGIIFVDYMIKNKKFPVKEVLLFILICAPLFLFYYFHFHTFLPNTLEVKQDQYASGLWMKFFPGTKLFADLLLKEYTLLKAFIPLCIIGGISLLFSRSIWHLMASWAVLHTLGYCLLRVAFYHWYSIPLVFLVMLMSAFSLRFITFVPHFFKDSQIKKWNIQIFNLDINISLAKLRETSLPLKWTYGIISLIIIASLLIALYGGLVAYEDSYKKFPFPKLELYTKVGKWIAKNSPIDASVAALEVGYIGYHAQREIIDLVGLVTPGVSEHIRQKDFTWAMREYKPDYFIYNLEFQGWLKTILDQPWFRENYKHIEAISQPGYPFPIHIYKKITDF